MKQKLSFLLALEGVVCIAYVLLGQTLPDLFGTAVSFPFQQIGLGLRLLSLSGTAGNVAAIILYAAVCLLPAGYLLCISKKRGLHGEDYLLLLLSLVLFPVLYLLVNPHLQERFLGTAMALAGSSVLGLTVYSVLAGWCILRLLRRFFCADAPVLMTCLKALLLVLAALMVMSACGTELDALLASFQNLRSSNQGTESTLGTTYCFLVLQYGIQILPQFLCCGILLHAWEMLGWMKTDPYCEDVISAAEKLSRRCGGLLVTIVLSNVGFNLLQLLFAKKLRVVDSNLSLPLDILVLVIVLLLAAQLIRSHKELKEENESFI